MYLVLLTIVLCLSVVLGNQQSNLFQQKLTYFENLIKAQKVSQQSYKRPINNDRFMPVSGNVKDFGSYDFIIVGGGSGGATLASRLSENRKFSILLVEAGGEEGDYSQIPAAMLDVTNSPLDWGYLTEPQTHSCLAQPEQRCPYPRGLLLGGSSAINAMAYIRGNREDYDLWGQSSPGWSYEDLLPYFKRSERTRLTDIDWNYHGRKGPLNVERNQRHWMVDRLIVASDSIGMEYNRDYNGEEQLGSTLLQATTLHGVRHSVNQAYLQPVRERRSNLKIVTGAFVTRVLTKKVEKDIRAIGIEFSYHKEKYQAFANLEVILSAGSINTPHLLILSGIGPTAELSKLGIQTVVNAPAVGKHLIDHPTLFSIPCTTNQTDPEQSLRDHIKDYLKGVGNLATVVTHVIDFIQMYNTHAPSPDLEIMLNPRNNALLRYLSDPDYNDLSKSPAATVPLNLDIIAMLTHPKSRGSVTAVNSDPYAFPKINPRLLSDPNDLNSMVDAVFKVLLILDTPEMKGIDAKLNWDMAPIACGEPNVNSRVYWSCFVQQETGSLFHPVSTCRMGANKSEAVVDNCLRVFGIKGLRIADGSVIPVTIAGHTNPICIVVGEKAADLIKSDYKT